MKIKHVHKAAGHKVRQIAGFFRASVTEWLEDKVLRQAAALAYYSIFSLAPLLVITIALAGFFFGEQAVEGEIVNFLSDYVGYEGAVFIENMVRQARETGTGLGATLISLGTMLFGALVIFSALQDALNQIWGVEPHPEVGVIYTLKRRLLAFLMILCVGVLLLFSFLVTAAFAIAQTYWESWFGTEFQIWAYTDQVFSLVFFTVIFAVIYKLLPDVEMAWRDMWLGAFMTALLFMFGELAISTYLAYSSVGSVFGAAGTLAVLLIWIYYCWTVILMGAEMTQVWARKYGGGIKPGKNAVLRIDMTKKVHGGRIKVVRETEEGLTEEVPIEEVEDIVEYEEGPVTKTREGIKRHRLVQRQKKRKEKDRKEKKETKDKPAGE